MSKMQATDSGGSLSPVVDDMDNNDSRDSSLFLGTIVLIIVIIAYVILKYIDPTDDDTIKDLLTYASPFLAILIVARKQDSIEQDTKTIKKNTNGVLSAHVDDIANAAVQRALAANSNNNTNEEG